MTHSGQFGLQTQGNDDMHDVTGQVQQIILESGMLNGIVTVFVVGSTAGVTTIEYEPGLAQDMAKVMERIAPRDDLYAHEARWDDDNGHSHIRASLLGPSITLPFSEGQLAVGTWQQIVLVDFDTRPRNRTVIVQVLGE
ncbi:MAG: secondary thiamine-phosphate synthase enzyme YjbQ [Fimbriimonadia bacterium]|nr:secondary thiamine-phosphate synthase enzyme YjbQ [Fimbriimonadia bacterium]